MAVRGTPSPKDENGAKEWLRNKLMALASLPEKLGMKASEVLPGIIGTIISWILNRAADVVLSLSCTKSVNLGHHSCRIGLHVHDD